MLSGGSGRAAQRLTSRSRPPHGSTARPLARGRRGGGVVGRGV